MDRMTAETDCGVTSTTADTASPRRTAMTDDEVRNRVIVIGAGWGAWRQPAHWRHAAMP